MWQGRQLGAAGRDNGNSYIWPGEQGQTTSGKKATVFFDNEFSH
jgi:hypothetical protein